MPGPDDAAGVVLRALELGVSCLDTAPDWGPFENELLIGAHWRAGIGQLGKCLPEQCECGCLSGNL